MTLIYCGLNAIANQLDMTLGFVWPWGIPTARGHLIIMMSWPLGTLFSDKLVFWCWNTSCWHCFYMSTFPSKPLDWRNKFSKTIIIPLAGNQDLRKGHVSQLVTQNIESMITWSWSLLRVRSRTLNTCHDYHHHQQHHQQHQHHHHHQHQHQQHHQPYDTLSSHLPPHCFGALAGMYIYIYLFIYIFVREVDAKISTQPALTSQEMPLKELQKDCREMEADAVSARNMGSGVTIIKWASKRSKNTPF